MKADILSRLRRLAGVVPMTALLVSVAIGAALDARWYTLASDEQRLIIANLASIHSADGGTSVQEAQIYATPLQIQGASQPVRRLDLQMVLDCRSRTSRVTHFSAFGQDGRALLDWNSSGGQGAWRAPEAGSANSTLIGTVCGGTPDPAGMHQSSDILQIQKLYLDGVRG